MSASYFNLGINELRCLHKKGHFSNKGGEWNETVKSYSGRQLSGPKRGPSEVVYQDDSCVISAAESLTITEEDVEGLSRRVPCFEMAYTDIMPRDAQQGNGRIPI